MMSADNAVMYSGVPQEDWENKSNYPKILSNGPKTPKAAAKSRNTGLIAFLILSFITICISLFVVFGLKYYNYSELTETVESSVKNVTDVVVTQPNHATSLSPPKPLTDKPNTIDQHQKQDMPSDKEPDKSQHQPIPPPTTAAAVTVTSDDHPQVAQITEDKLDLTTEDTWMDIIKTDDDNYPYNDLPSSSSEVITHEEMPNKSNNMTEKESHKNNKHEEDEGETDVDDDMYDIWGLSDTDKDTKNTNKMNANSTTNNDEPISKDEQPVNDASLSDIISNFASKYFNSTHLNKDDIKEWIDRATSQPSLEVIIIASAIIFVGIALLVIAITCIVTRTRKVRIRREKFNRAVSDLEGAEKVILLTDEPSEDEYVKT